ncbi:MAG: hypothetical protein GY874_02330 [Desulfobacteraceae bacterium]|nr:hypothetical protein [Desulfobacteraceae bacterium]
MDRYQELANKLLELNQKVMGLLGQSESCLDDLSPFFLQWRQTCENIEQQLMDHVVRVAVVGAIKSGKSTLVNSLLGQDYLKRGAGVVTSIVTRIRHGDNLRARLFLKSWDEINAEIEQALVLFPPEQWQSENENLDIRRKQDRSDLSRALESLDSGLRISQGQLNAKSVLLSSYLKGYDKINAIVGADSAIQVYEAGQFGDHRGFAGNDAQAVYLKDIELEIPCDNLTGNVEIADCQGSDSPNPLHMAMIQDYLLKAHLIVYVISSRTGLRQADIQFLNMIKKMGIAANMIFVCNSDLNEHDDLCALNELVQRVREELALILPDTELFTFSALFNLFLAQEDKLGSKDLKRLHQWRDCDDLIEYSNNETLRLEKTFHTKLNVDRSSLLLQNQLERLDVLSSALNQWVSLNRGLMQRNAGQARELADLVKKHQEHIQQVQSMLNSTLDGALQKIKQELRRNIDNFFDLYNGPVLKKIIRFIYSYEADISNCETALQSSGFNQALYLAFQSFKQRLDAFMTESVNPEIIAFAIKQEAYLKQCLKQAVEPYETMAHNALTQMEDALSQIGLPIVSKKWSFDIDLDLEAIKNVVGLSMPSASATMRYSAYIKTDAVLHFGAFALIRAVRKIFKKSVDEMSGEQLKALSSGVRRMKKETERSMVEHFTDYRENIKFQYMIRLADSASRQLYETLTERFQGYLAGLEQADVSAGKHKNDKEKMDAALAGIANGIESVRSGIKTFRHEMDRLNYDSDEF